MRIRLILGILLLLLGVTALLHPPAVGHAQEGQNEVLLLTVEGPVTPAMGAYLERGLEEAERDDAELLILRLDTPGGSTDVMSDIVKVLLAADVPVATYVWPSGGRAASAGTFIVLASDFAAMAPRTTIGAASPVGGQGQEISETLEQKITNDLVAAIKSHAERRGPEAVEWAEQAVRQAVSANESEALEIGIIDVVASDVSELLDELDGRTVASDDRSITLSLENAMVREVPMTPIERFFHLIANPNIALLLLSLGGTAIVIELYQPGGYVAGTFGVIALLLGFYSLGVLQANYAGLALIGLAFALFLLEATTPTLGVWALGGAVAFILGALMLFDTSYAPVSRSLVVGVAGTLGAFFVFAIGAALRARSRPPVTGRRGLIGRIGRAEEPLDPEGIVLVYGERWTAVSRSGAVERGQRVRVVDVDGMQLIVEPPEAETQHLEESALRSMENGANTT